MKTAKKVAVATTLAAAVAAFIVPFEGVRLQSYRDPADPMLWTVCMGETKGIKQGMVFTRQECEDMLISRVPEFLAPVDKLMPGLPDNRRLAYTDLAYNAGVGILTRRRNGVPGTSIVDLERAGKWRQACDRVLLFVYAGGKKFNGLVKRRQAEHKVCVTT